MRPNPQETADLVTSADEVFKGKLLCREFCLMMKDVKH